jgi:hypothetical protein
MLKFCNLKKGSTWCPVVILLYFVINIRVEAGIATVLERALDGLVGGVVLLVLIYISARFFKILNPADSKDHLACCDDEEKQ